MHVGSLERFCYTKWNRSSKDCVRYKCLLAISWQRGSQLDKSVAESASEPLRIRRIVLQLSSPAGSVSEIPRCQSQDLNRRSLSHRTTCFTSWATATHGRKDLSTQRVNITAFQTRTLLLCVMSTSLCAYVHLVQWYCDASAERKYTRHETACTKVYRLS